MSINDHPDYISCIWQIALCVQSIEANPRMYQNCFTLCLTIIPTTSLNSTRPHAAIFITSGAYQDLYILPWVLWYCRLILFPHQLAPRPAGGWGARVSACADLPNQLQFRWVDPSYAWKKDWHSNCWIPVVGGLVLFTGAIKSGVLY